MYKLQASYLTLFQVVTDTEQLKDVLRFNVQASKKHGFITFRNLHQLASI